MAKPEINIRNKKTVLYSLRAPAKLALRPSGNKKGQSYRSVFMRDRDRILYSKSFRRLAGKTQVYLSGNDDHKRTRLTHTLEVSQIAKTISNSLKLDVDLTEAIALGHDIGHTPFGHAGERILHKIMTPQSEDHSLIHDCPLENLASNAYDNYLGFKHNLQSVHVAINSEKSYESYGLDLTNFTLYGMNIHSSTNYKSGTNNEKLGYYAQFEQYMHLENSITNAWSFEAFVVKEADEIAQRHHDLEDAIRGQLISKEEVIKQIRINFSDCLISNDRKLLKAMGETVDNEMYISLLSRLVVNLFVTRIIKCSIHNLNVFIQQNRLTEKSFPDYILSHSETDICNLIAYDYNDDNPTFQTNMKNFEKYLTNKVLSSYDIQNADARGQYIIRKIFQAYYTTPQQLPDHCIIEFCKCAKIYLASEIQLIISEKGMGVIRSDFASNFSQNMTTENSLILMRVICNHISGMTDTFAQKIYRELYI